MLTNLDHAAVQQVLDDAVADGGVPGIVAEVRDGDHRWFGAAGLADVDSGRERLPQDQFRIGSITKAFTAAVVLKLVAEHRLRLDDTVEHWLPGLVRGNGNDGSKITIRHLLNQTSGLVSYDYDDQERLDQIVGPPYLQHRFDRWRPEQLIQITLKHRPHFEPGVAFRYSNANYMLAGLIIERAAGGTYAAELDRLVLRPLGLTGTYLPGDETTIRGSHARMYSKLFLPDADAEVHDVTEVDPSWGWAAGGIVSTTGDLATFFDALLDGRLLPPDLHREMWTTVPTEGAGWIPNTRYGMGVWEQDLPSGTTVRGGGGAMNGSWTYAMGVGEHLVVSNMNGDWNNPVGTFVNLLEVELGIGATRHGSRPAR